MTSEQILTDYYTSKLALEILQKEVKEKKQAVIDILIKEPGSKARIEYASFSLKSYPVYTYSSKVTKIQNDLMFVKKEEVVTGVAKIKSETYSPVMRKLKGGGK